MNYKKDGTLMPGIYPSSWADFARTHSQSKQRKRLIAGLYRLVEILSSSGCRTIYLGGSLVTKKRNPADFDACFDATAVDLESLRRLEPALLHDFEQDTTTLRHRYGGTMEPIVVFPPTGTTILEFFQFDTRTGRPKGVLAIKLDNA